MARIIVLDAGPLGLASKPTRRPDADGCREWIRELDEKGARVVVPEIADYEVRRELLRVGATAGLRRLDRLEAALDYDPITTPALRLAAEFWAFIRRGGKPTADVHALDGDCILAAQSAVLGGPQELVTIATTNVGHLDRFPWIDADTWTQISPRMLGVSLGANVEFFNGTTLEDVINKEVDVFLKGAPPTITAKLFCRTFVRRGRLWLDLLPEIGGKYIAPLPDDAIISRNETELDIGRYAIFLGPTSTAGQMLKSLIEAANKGPSPQ